MDTESSSYILGVRKLVVWCRQQAVAPKSSQARIVLRSKSKKLVNQSPNSDVYRSRIRGKEVALKSIRVHGDAREPLVRVSVQRTHENTFTHWRQTLYLAAPIWRCVRHPNITEFLGITDALPVCLVSEWMSGGSLMTYLHEHPDEHRTSFVRVCASPTTYC
jgi:serine/threonine protein kinase